MQGTPKLGCRHDQVHLDTTFHVIMLPAGSPDHLGGPYACSPGGEIFLLIRMCPSEMRLRGGLIIHLKKTNVISGKYQTHTHTRMRMFTYSTLRVHRGFKKLYPSSESRSLAVPRCVACLAFRGQCPVWTRFCFARLFPAVGKEVKRIF